MHIHKGRKTCKKDREGKGNRKRRLFEEKGKWGDGKLSLKKYQQIKTLDTYTYGVPALQEIN